MQKRRAIVWFRQDLRVHDNEALSDAQKQAQEVIPIYVFDERLFRGKTRWYGFRKTERYRAKFIIESVADLRQSLRQLGSDLIVRVGKPEEVIFELARQIKTNWVFCNRERTEEEIQVQDALEKNLWSIGQEMRYYRGKLLYYTADLPFPINHTPDTFSQFRKEVERYVPVRDPLPVPDPFGPVTAAIHPGDIPTLEDLGYADFEPDPRAAIDFTGGESAALERLDYYFWQSGAVNQYKESRDHLLGEDYSTKFSPWLAQGCLSPKMVYHELERYEAERGAAGSTYEIFYQLMLRDFYRFMAKKHENKIFLKGGVEGERHPEWRNDRKLLQRWKEGRTGVPFIDANMREIKNTGYMSNRGRQLTAGFLVHDLGVNWQMGAEYFESLLIDYDVASNWCNWQEMAGVGPDSRDGRSINVLAQAQRLDPDGAFVKTWIPELADLPSDKIHDPHSMSFQEQEEHHIRIGDDYPKAVVGPEKWRR